MTKVHRGGSIVPCDTMSTTDTDYTSVLFLNRILYAMFDTVNEYLSYSL